MDEKKLFEAMDRRRAIKEVLTKDEVGDISNTLDDIGYDYEQWHAKAVRAIPELRPYADQVDKLLSKMLSICETAWVKAGGEPAGPPVKH